MKKFDIAVIGELNVDLIFQDISTFPQIGKEVIAKNMTQTLGSASAILASNIAKLGLHVAFLGKLGCDSYGDLVLSELNDKGVDCSGIVMNRNSRTGITVSMTFPEDYSMITYPGVMEDFCLDDVDFDFISKARHMHFSSFYLQPGIRPDCARLFQKVKEMGLTTSFDPGWDPEEKWDPDIFSLLDHVDIFLPNEIEALNITHTQSVNEAFEKLGQHSSTIVIKQGSKGAILQSNHTILKAKAFRVEPVDTTGAGDSFNAGFLSQWLQRKNLKECLRTGNACGALAITRLGGSTASPTKKELEEFLTAKTISK